MPPNDPMTPQRLREIADQLITQWVDDCGMQHEDAPQIAAELRAHADQLERNGERKPETIESYFVRQSDWSARTFGQGTRTQGILEHIRKELEEVAASPHDLEEWIDLTMLAMDGFWRHGGDPRDILKHLNAKQAKNFARKWHTPQDGHAVEHVREIDQARANVKEEGR